MSTVFALLYHDVWETGEEYPPEEISIDGIYATAGAAEAARAEHEAHWQAQGMPTADYYTIEAHAVLDDEPARDPFGTLFNHDPV